MTYDIHEDADVDAMTDHDAVTEVVFNQTTNGDTRALAPDETFDWPAIEAEHTRHALSYLTAQGLSWNPDTGTITCPSGMDAAQAAAVWDRARDQADNRVLDIIDEIRQGKPIQEDAERTAGHEWVSPF
ncbi:hypothetical protein ACFC08_28410 [Streptomyces sp. NPDC056112]|uniref:hypothetical protein n=1 Tax=Streptomyces sp. NPDC056112 TaxID=3345715 RepID=UPI0035E1D906